MKKKINRLHLRSAAQWRLEPNKPTCHYDASTKRYSALEHQTMRPLNHRSIKVFSFFLFFLCFFSTSLVSYSFKHTHTPNKPNLNLKSLNPFPRLLNTLINLVRICALANRRWGTRLATSLTADDGCDSRSPLGAVCACVFERLYVYVSMLHCFGVKTTKNDLPR